MPNNIGAIERECRSPPRKITMRCQQCLFLLLSSLVKNDGYFIIPSLCSKRYRNSIISDSHHNNKRRVALSSWIVKTLEPTTSEQPKEKVKAEEENELDSALVLLSEFFQCSETSTEEFTSMLKSNSTTLSLNLTPCEYKDLPNSQKYIYRLLQLSQSLAQASSSSSHFDDDESFQNWCKTQKYEYNLYLRKQPSLLQKISRRRHVLLSLGFLNAPSNDIAPSSSDDSSPVISKQWLHQYNQLKEYKAIHNHVNVPQQYDRSNLGKWVHNQRTFYRTYQKQQASPEITTGTKISPMTPEKIKLLESIGFVWNTKQAKSTQYDLQWNTTYQKLHEYYKEHGHINVTSKENKYLKYWITQQRTRYRQKYLYNVSSLTDERFQLLDDLGFVWDVTNRTKRQQSKEKTDSEYQSIYKDKSWNEYFQELQEYYQTHNHTLVPKSYTSSSSSSPLGLWVNLQRMLHKQYQKDGGDQGESNNEGNGSYGLTKEKIQKLKSVNFVWDNLQNAKWWNKYNQLVSYCNNHQRSQESRQLLSISLKKENPKLAKWLSTQRRYYRQYVSHHNKVGTNKMNPSTPSAAKINMTEEKKQALDEIGFFFTPDGNNDNESTIFLSAESKNASWHRTFQELVQFKKHYNHTNVPQSFPSNPKLGHWVSENRKQYLYYLQHQLHQVGQEGRENHEYKRCEGEDVKLTPVGENTGDHNRSIDQKVQTEEERRKKRKTPTSTFLTYPERLEKLESIGFTWVVRKRRQTLN